MKLFFIWFCVALGASFSRANDRCPLIIADTVNIYSNHNVDIAMQKNAISGNKGLTAFYESMLLRGGSRYIIKTSNDKILDGLYKQAPNFSHVIDHLKLSLSIAVNANEPISFTPILLTGDPGVGKTHFANSLAGALGTGYEYIPIGNATAGWILSGASAGWKDAKHGKLADKLVNGNEANPIIVLDEIDKSGQGKTYDPLGALYGLLEHDTAKIFKDEYIDVEMDASHVLWIATANDVSLIPEPILNRMEVFEVKLPDADGSKIIAQNVYRALLQEHPGLKFSPELPEAVIEKLRSIYPRDMKKVLKNAIGAALQAKRDLLSPSDIDLSRNAPGKRPIGFR